MRAHSKDFTKDGQILNLCGANLMKVNLKHAQLLGVDLRGAYLNQANLEGAMLMIVDLRGANLSEANLKGAYLRSSDLGGISLSKANLSVATLSVVNLSGADLSEANLSGAHLENVNLAAVHFQLKPGALPDPLPIAYARNLSKMYFSSSPNSLIELRDALKKAGFREQERQITFAIERTRREQTTSGKLRLSSLEGLFRFIAFETTSGYGMSPGRPLWILIGLIFIFFIPYFISLIISQDSRAGIWKEWSKDRIFKNEDETEFIRLRGIRKIGYALYFSVLSAFHLGWRDLNVGTWISKMQPNEYNFRATGWVRTLSGIQSLLSVYLLALSILTYFGSPFE